MRSAWLKLQLPFGLWWRTDLFHILDVSGQIGLANDPVTADSIAFVLSKRDKHGRWPLEIRNPDRTQGCSPLWNEETVGQPSKWVTLTVLTLLDRFCNVVRQVESGELPDDPPQIPKHTEFAAYPFADGVADEDRVRRLWANTKV